MQEMPLREETLAEYLRSVGLSSQQDLLVDRVGEGNINWVRRARTRDGARAWVVKQARPALERFPEYRVSTERIVFEARYYETAAPFDREGVCPRVHHFDPGRRVLVLEDLSAGVRLDAHLARTGADDAATLAAARRIGRFLGTLHAGTRGEALAERFRNDEMRRLHGDHVFALPYRPNDFPLAPAVARRARAIWSDAALVSRIDASYERYLSTAAALVHADVQPTNLLLLGERVVLLDAEIAHVGDPAFDVGVFVAHLWLAAAARGPAASAPRAARELASAWAQALGPGAPAWSEVTRYAGIEMLRRTIGAARVAAADDEANSLRFIDLGLALI
jgi:5-methylthioribose kinase